MFFFDLPFEIAILQLVIIVIAIYLTFKLLQALFQLLQALITWLATVAVPWVVETAGDVWDWAAEVEARAEKKLKEIAEKIAAAVATTLTLIPNWKVYEIIMIEFGEYDKRIWGDGWSTKHDYPTHCGGDNTFKYGTTTKETLPERYRNGYISQQLNIGRLGEGFFLRGFNVYTAHAEEVALISIYVGKHATFPLGNLKLG